MTKRVEDVSHMASGDICKNYQSLSNLLFTVYFIYMTEKFSSQSIFLYITYHTKPSANGFLYLNPCKLNVSSPAYTFLDVFFPIVMVLCCSTGLVICNGEMVGFIKSAVQVWMEDKKPKAMII